MSDPLKQTPSCEVDRDEWLNDIARRERYFSPKNLKQAASNSAHIQGSAENNDDNLRIAADLRATTERMANVCHVEMGLWNEHSNAALAAAAALETKQGNLATRFAEVFRAGRHQGEMDCSERQLKADKEPTRAEAAPRPLRPDWHDIYKDTAAAGFITSWHNETVLVTRESARLGADALSKQCGEDYYHNLDAAHRELYRATKVSAETSIKAATDVADLWQRRAWSAYDALHAAEIALRNRDQSELDAKALRLVKLAMAEIDPRLAPENQPENIR